MLRQQTNELAKLLLLQAGRDDTASASDDVVDAFLALGLTDEEADMAMNICALLVFKGIPLPELQAVTFAACRKVLSHRVFQ